LDKLFRGKVHSGLCTDAVIATSQHCNAHHLVPIYFFFQPTVFRLLSTNSFLSQSVALQWLQLHILFAVDVADYFVDFE